MRQYAGPVLVGIGGLHTVVGLYTFRHQFTAIVRDGLFNAVLPQLDRQTALWFSMTGVVVMLWGTSITWAERQTGTVPPGLHWHLLGVGSLGVVLMPRSGFWLLLPVAMVAWAGRRSSAPAHPSHRTTTTRLDPGTR